MTLQKSVVRSVVAAMAATLLLVSVGSFVRATGAGLGCPDWPLCFGRLLPPTRIEQVPHDMQSQWNFVKAWIEYVNRLLGVIVGILSLIAVFVTWRHARRTRRDVFVPVLIGCIAVIVAGGLGARVVRSELDPRFVSIHLFVGLTAALAYVLAAVNAAATPAEITTVDAPIDSGRAARRLTWVAFALTVLQMVQGAVVRGDLELVARAEPSLARGQWIDRVGFVDLSHRASSLVVALLVVIAWSAIQRGAHGVAASRPARAMPWAHANVAIVIAQIVAGFVLAYGPLPPTFQVIHVTLGAWLAAALLVQARLLAR